MFLLEVWRWSQVRWVNVHSPAVKPPLLPSPQPLYHSTNHWCIKPTERATDRFQDNRMLSSLCCIIMITINAQCEKLGTRSHLPLEKKYKHKNFWRTAGCWISYYFSCNCNMLSRPEYGDYSVQTPFESMNIMDAWAWENLRHEALYLQVIVKSVYGSGEGEQVHEWWRWAGKYCTWVTRMCNTPPPNNQYISLKVERRNPRVEAQPQKHS